MIYSGFSVSAFTSNAIGFCIVGQQYYYIKSFCQIKSLVKLRRLVDPYNNGEFFYKSAGDGEWKYNYDDNTIRY